MDYTEIEIEGMKEILRDKEEENKNLKLTLEQMENTCKDYLNDRDTLREENRKLEKENFVMKDRLKFGYKGVTREEIDKAEEENRKLKSDLSECECSFGFENDEVGFWKREYKRLKQRIKDHCKGYGNLFPEDEMKRQRKKADKKRKKSDLYKDVGLMEEDTLQELRDIGEI